MWGGYCPPPPSPSLCAVPVLTRSWSIRLENGLDNSGVFLDALSAFWNSFYDCCALMAMREFQSSGTICRLPSGRPLPEELSKDINKLVFFYLN